MSAFKERNKQKLGFTKNSLRFVLRTAANAHEIFNMYHGICLIYKYVNEVNIPTVVKKFTAEWRSKE